MVTHYIVENSQVACGRNNHNLAATSQRERVTCKSCRRSEKFAASASTQAAPLANKGVCGKSSVTRLVLAELTRPKGLWREYWIAHIRNISPANRLPRGFKEPSPLINLDL